MFDKKYIFQTIHLPDDYEGKVVATLIKSKANASRKKSILYLHGFIDYFFHDHLADEFIAHEFDFYALDMRKYGRSILPHQHANYCRDIHEYFEEISESIDIISTESGSDIYLLGHSTGGLTASCYMNFGEKKDRIKGLVLNSPFLDFNLSPFEKQVSLFISRIMSKISKYSKLNGVLSPAYAESLHKEHHGEWDFNKNWKPINGFPTYFIWIIAIHKAQESLKQSAINVPILVMHSSGSVKLKSFSEKAVINDTVLNIEDIQRVGVQLGNDATLLEVNNAKHDIFLSLPEVRATALKDMFNWLTQIA